MNGLRIFYREAGSKDASTILLLHGFPTSSHMSLDYASNVALYPKFQEYFRTKRPSMLAVWGNNDPFFLPPGAEAFRRDNPNAEVHFYDTGHFALETHYPEIGGAIREFLDRRLTTQERAA